MRLTKDRRGELRKVYRECEIIQDAETPREADMLTGYVVGVISEKKKTGKLSGRTAKAIIKMIEAVGEGKRLELQDQQERREYESKKKEEQQQELEFAECYDADPE